MMRNIFAALILLLLAHSRVSAQQTVTIKGKVRGDLKGHTAVYVYGQDVKTDTAYIANGSFEMTLPFTGPFIPLFYDEYDVKVKRGVSPFPIVIDSPGTVYLDDIDIDKGLYSGKISGVKSAVDFDRYNNSLDLATRGIKTQLLKKYGDSISIKPQAPNYKAYLNDFQTRRTEMEHNALISFVKANPDAYLSTYLLARNKSAMNMEALERTYELLSVNARQSVFGKSTGEYIAGMKKSRIGQQVVDFTLPDPSDKPFSFNELKGKYVIIDFWASWCGPCKASFPHMKELYKKYKSDRFEIYSISIDQSKQAWLAELKKQDLPWLQALDTKSISNSAFAVTAVPTTFMIDPQGKILLKEVGLDSSGNGSLEKKLVELFGKK